MDEKKVVLKIMLDNYLKNGNSWLSGKMVMHGYEIKEFLTKHVYYPQLSRRLSDLNIKLPSGRKLAFDKFKRYQDTPYTAYRILTNLNKKDIEFLKELTK